MIPKLFEIGPIDILGVTIGPIAVYSYGLMLALAFIIGSYLLSKELERKKFDPSLATSITLMSLILGIIGAKLFHLLEHFDRFLNNPIDETLSPAGLIFYGGLLLAIAGVYFYVKIKKKIPFLTIADAASPALALSYGIARIGCHLSGDGDYGIPTELPWGVNYENGIVPPSYAFQGSEIAKLYPGGIVPDSTPLHPTPIYELIAAIIVFSILWKLRKNEWIDGKLFMFYLILTGFPRLLVEFIRLNPIVAFGLSQAQIVSVFLIIGGFYGLYYFHKHPELKKFTPPPLKQTVKKKK